jgi:hypothetical protein
LVGEVMQCGKKPHSTKGRHIKFAGLIFYFRMCLVKPYQGKAGS